MSAHIEKPNSFGWSVEEIENLKEWALTQPHPHTSDLSLWEFLDEGDSVLTLNKAQKHIK